MNTWILDLKEEEEEINNPELLIDGKKAAIIDQYKNKIILGQKQISNIRKLISLLWLLIETIQKVHIF